MGAPLCQSKLVGFTRRPLSIAGLLPAPSGDLYRSATIEGAHKCSPMIMKTLLLWGIAVPALLFNSATSVPASDRNWKELFPSGLVDSEGKQVPLSSLEGKIVCLYFSASWCGPCKAFTPKLVALREHAKEHFEVVLVSQDRSEAKQLKYMRETGMKWPAARWADYRIKDGNQVRELISKYQGWGIPTVAVLSAEGKVLDRNARLKVQFLPEDLIKQFENYDYDRALKRYREQRERTGKSLSEAEAKEYLRHARSFNEKRIREAKALLEKPIEVGSPNGKPTWEQLLLKFYDSQRHPR